jgi:hypothetical protein
MRPRLQISKMPTIMHVGSCRAVGLVPGWPVLAASATRQVVFHMHKPLTHCIIHCSQLGLLITVPEMFAMSCVLVGGTPLRPSAPDSPKTQCQSSVSSPVRVTGQTESRMATPKLPADSKPILPESASWLSGGAGSSSTRSAAPESRRQPQWRPRCLHDIRSNVR